MANPCLSAPETAGPASNILGLIECKNLEDDVFTHVYEQWQPPAARGVYGGATIGLSLFTFLRAGSIDRRLTFHVTRIRQGHSFATRTVKGRDQDEAVLVTTVSFTRQNGRSLGTVQHSIAPFEIPKLPGDSCEERPEWTLAEPFQRRPIDEISKSTSNHPSMNRSIFRQWIRFPGVIPETGASSVHLHALAFLTDSYFILTAARLHRLWRLPFSPEDVSSLSPELRSQIQRVCESEGVGSTVEEWAKHPRTSMVTSLDHSIYFHEPLRIKADEWMVSEMGSPWAAHGRALVVQRIFSKDGTLLVTCSQEVRLSL
ncbi:hypothetical protein FOYG_15745 [Fusarium oxysporum NRRL 32931]|uniref:Palmitoyl-CoA hydrolase n=1 Tax=Fusarium oxysporum NRRL 32931 TaxID=660029 RepID=W9HMV0_FUSOX|nr:hypothetical protein FOYG_15745 [Fusarium oxysporum NRRL 32931]